MNLRSSDNKIRKQVTISRECIDLVVRSDIRNLSGFIDDLIFDKLSDKKFRKRLLIKQLTDLREQFEKINYELEFNIKPKKPKEIIQKSNITIVNTH